MSLQDCTPALRASLKPSSLCRCTVRMPVQAAVEACWRSIVSFNANTMYDGLAPATRIDDTALATLMSLLPVGPAGPSAPLSNEDGVKVTAALQCLARLATLPAAARFMTEVLGESSQPAPQSGHLLDAGYGQSRRQCFLLGLTCSRVPGASSQLVQRLEMQGVLSLQLRVSVVVSAACVACTQESCSCQTCRHRASLWATLLTLSLWCCRRAWAHLQPAGPGQWPRRSRGSSAPHTSVGPWHSLCQPAALASYAGGRRQHCRGCALARRQDSLPSAHQQVMLAIAWTR